MTPSLCRGYTRLWRLIESEPEDELLTEDCIPIVDEVEDDGGVE